MGAQTTYSNSFAIGYSGQLDESAPYSLLTMKNVEVSASMRIGTAVVFKTSSPASDLDALLPAATTDKVAGIIVLADTFARTYTDSDGNTVGQLDGTGLVTGTVFNVATKGRMLVTAATAVVPGDRLYVRCDAGEGSEYLGALENASDESDMIDCTNQGRWLTTASAGNLAWLEFDFSNK